MMKPIYSACGEDSKIDEMPQSSDQTLFSNRFVSNRYSMYLGDIEEPKKYLKWFEIMRMASPEDSIEIHINSYGGDLFTAIQFMRCMEECQAQVTAIVEGACMSAATLIFLSAKNVSISDHSVFMFHNYSGGVWGKGGELMDRVAFDYGWSEKLWRSVYVDFLTEKEIQMILQNKDIWLEASDVLDRLEKRNKKIVSNNKRQKKK